MRIMPSAALLLLAACKADVPPPLTAGMTAPQAVTAAANSPNGVEGTFSLMVRSMTMVGSTLYLNSQMDGRDPRNLTIAVEPEAIAGLRDKLGDSPQVVLKGRDIWVKGTAKRVRMDIVENGKPTGKFYDQIQVKVTDASQISQLAN